MVVKEAADGQLDTAEGVAAAVKKMFADEKLRRPRICGFSRNFQYPKALEVFKNRNEFPHHKAQVLVSDTDNLVRWIRA